MGLFAEVGASIARIARGETKKQEQARHERNQALVGEMIGSAPHFSKAGLGDRPRATFVLATLGAQDHLHAPDLENEGYESTAKVTWHQITAEKLRLPKDQQAKAVADLTEQAIAAVQAKKCHATFALLDPTTTAKAAAELQQAGYTTRLEIVAQPALLAEVAHLAEYRQRLDDANPGNKESSANIPSFKPFDQDTWNTQRNKALQEALDPRKIESRFEQVVIVAQYSQIPDHARGTVVFNGQEEQNGLRGAAAALAAFVKAPAKELPDEAMPALASAYLHLNQMGADLPDPKSLIGQGRRNLAAFEKALSNLQTSIDDALSTESGRAEIAKQRAASQQVDQPAQAPAQAAVQAPQPTRATVGESHPELAPAGIADGEPGRGDNEDSKIIPLEMEMEAPDAGLEERARSVPPLATRLREVISRSPQEAFNSASTPRKRDAILKGVTAATPDHATIAVGLPEYHQGEYGPHTAAAIALPDTDLERGDTRLTELPKSDAGDRTSFTALPPQFLPEHQPPAEPAVQQLGDGRLQVSAATLAALRSANPGPVEGIPPAAVIAERTAATIAQKQQTAGPAGERTPAKGNKVER